MQFNRFFAIRLISIFWVNKTPKVHTFVVKPNLSNPFINASVPCDSFVSAGVVNTAATVPHVFASRNFTQVFNAIVCGVVVNVIKLAFWVNATMPKPNKMVLSVKPPINSKNNVSVWSRATANCAELAINDLFDSFKLRVVSEFKKLFKTRLSNKVMLVHAVVPSKQWLESARKRFAPLSGAIIA
jgi:hypothetical protein